MPAKTPMSDHEIFYFEEQPHVMVKSALLRAYHAKFRIRVWYGDTKTGASWSEENDVLGKVSRSTGEHKIPLLIHNSRSMGGGEICTGRIIRIDRTDTGEKLYEHATCTLGTWSTIDGVVFKDGQIWARFDGVKCIDKAKRYIDFMLGKRYSK